MQLKKMISSFLTDSGLSKQKDWYLSRTVWVNIIAIAVMVAQAQCGFIVAPQEQIAALAIINLALRAITGKELRK